MEIKPIITMISPELMKRFTDKHGEELFMRAVNLAEEYRKRWALDIYGPFDHSSSNMLFAGKSEKYGPMVLKVQMSDDLDKEVSVLRSFEGDCTCPVYEYSPDDRVCLLRRIWPGYTMFFETTREQRADIFCGLYKRLHKERVPEYKYPTHLDLLAEGNKVISQRDDCIFMAAHIKKAADIIMSVNSLYTERTVLHGDLHHENILRDDDGRYIIIDPKGIVGDPVYDVSRFIAFEFWCNLTSEPSGNVVDFVKLLSGKLGIPAEILFKCLYAETVIWLSREELARGKPPSDYGNLICNMLVAESFVDALKL